MSRLIFLTFIVLSAQHSQVVGQNTTSELILSRGYPLETHEIQTEDGYILTYYRIPYGKIAQNIGGAPKRPVLLQHGILGTSYDWFTQDEGKTLAFLLSEKGYDVWIGNARGTGYSNKHVKLTPKDKGYWNFCWEEMGMYDIPAAIDFILSTTGKETLHYIGYSMGTTQFFAMAALKLEYNTKVKLMSAFAPVAFTANVHNKMFDNIIKLLHFVKGKWDSPMGEAPNTSSLGAMIHYGQEILSKNFARFDFGLKNFGKYGSWSPPPFDPKLITVPIAFYSGSGDDLSTPKDVAHFAAQLPNLVKNYIVPRPEFTHVDFTRAADAYELVYVPAMEFMEGY